MCLVHLSPVMMRVTFPYGMLEVRKDWSRYLPTNRRTCELLVSYEVRYQLSIFLALLYFSQFQFPRYSNSIASLSYNHSGQLLAVASSYTFGEAKEKWVVLITFSFSRTVKFLLLLFWFIWLHLFLLSTCRRLEPPQVFIHKVNDIDFGSSYAWRKT